MKNLERRWILTGLIFLITGMVLGLIMGFKQDYSQRPLHAHLNLLGFVVMTLFGLCYRQWPKMQESVLAKVHYWLHTGTIAVGFVMVYKVLSNPDLGPKLGPIMDSFFALTALGVVLFTWLFFTRARD